MAAKMDNLMACELVFGSAAVMAAYLVGEMVVRKVDLKGISVVELTD
jgi:hypothetical protein